MYELLLITAVCFGCGSAYYAGLLAGRNAGFVAVLRIVATSNPHQIKRFAIEALQQPIEN